MQVQPPFHFPQISHNTIQTNSYKLKLTRTVDAKKFGKSLGNRVRRYSPPASSRIMNNLLDIHDLQALLKLGRSATYELIRDSKFPAPYVLSARTHRWDANEIETWMLSRKKSNTSKRTKRVMDKDPVADTIMFRPVGA